MIKPENLVVGKVYQLPVGQGELKGFEHFAADNHKAAGTIDPVATNDTRRMVFALLPGHKWEHRLSLYYARLDEIRYTEPAPTKVG